MPRKMLTFYNALLNFRCGKNSHIIKVIPCYDVKLTEVIYGFGKIIVNKDPERPATMLQQASCTRTARIIYKRRR